MIFNVHAGHNPAGKVACGAVALLNESEEARKIKDEVIRLLRTMGHTVYDCTVDDGTSQNDVLQKIVAKCNEHDVDADVSIHLNIGRNDYVGDGSIGGTEIFVYSLTAGAVTMAQSVVRNISALGYRIRDDRIKDDVKPNPQLYVLKNTKAPAMLIECCFIDDADDVAKYNYKTMAEAIVKGLTAGVDVEANPTEDISYVVDDRKSTAELVAEIRAGKWGNGKEREEAITKAGYNYAEIRALVNASYNGGTATPAPVQTVDYYKAYTGSSGSIVAALNAIGVNSSYNNRANIAAVNGISNYRGTAAQNIEMLRLLKLGQLKRA